ncbi:MAG: hypothetical protein WC856_02885 [Methylococcaceae bacterium]
MPIFEKFFLVPTRCDHRYTHLGVDRNKPVRALSAGQVFPAFRIPEAPETPDLADERLTYSELHLNTSFRHSCQNDGLGRTCV